MGKYEKMNGIRQGIISERGNTENCMKIRIGASDKDESDEKDKAIAYAYGNKCMIPLDFEILKGELK